MFRACGEGHADVEGDGNHRPSPRGGMWDELFHYGINPICFVADRYADFWALWAWCFMGELIKGKWAMR